MIWEVMLIIYTFLLWMDLVSVQCLFESSISSLWLHSIQSFSVSVYFTRIGFSEKFSSKLYYFADLNCICFPLELSLVPPVCWCHGLSWFLYSILLSALMEINQSIFLISSDYLFAAFFSCVIINITTEYQHIVVYEKKPPINA